MTKVMFKDLNGWLKTAVVISYAVGVLYAIAFVIGFFSALI